MEDKLGVESLPTACIVLSPVTKNQLSQFAYICHFVF